MTMNSNCLNPIFCICCTLPLTAHMMCFGSGLLLQGKKKKLWFTAIGGGKGENKNTMEIEPLKLNFYTNRASKARFMVDLFTKKPLTCKSSFRYSISIGNISSGIWP